MTQHFLTPTDPETADVIMVGHDQPLSTYFAQVYKQTDGDHAWVLWEGLAYGQLPYAHQAIELVRPYAHIPDELLQVLSNDCVRHPDPANVVTRWSATGRIETEKQASAGEDGSR